MMAQSHHHFQVDLRLDKFVEGVDSYLGSTITTGDNSFPDVVRRIVIASIVQCHVSTGFSFIQGSANDQISDLLMLHFVHLVV